MDTILGFQGQYRFLSNFYPCRVDFEERSYLSSEAAYQASKFSEEVRQDFSSIDARKARTLGKTLLGIRSNWEEMKLNVMYRILRVKFSKEPMRSRLLGTGDACLEETNYWRDIFWGIYNGSGENHLGRLLMVVRDEITEGII